MCMYMYIYICRGFSDRVSEEAVARQLRADDAGDDRACRTARGFRFRIRTWNKSCVLPIVFVCVIAVFS